MLHAKEEWSNGTYIFHKSFQLFFVSRFESARLCFSSLKLPRLTDLYRKAVVLLQSWLFETWAYPVVASCAIQHSQKGFPSGWTIFEQDRVAIIRFSMSAMTTFLDVRIWICLSGKTDQDKLWSKSSSIGYCGRLWRRCRPIVYNPNSFSLCCSIKI